MKALQMNVYSILYRKGVLNMSEKGKQRSFIESNQRLLMLGVSTFGALLIFNAPTLVHASEVSNSEIVSTQTESTDTSSNSVDEKDDSVTKDIPNDSTKSSEEDQKSDNSVTQQNSQSIQATQAQPSASVQPVAEPNQTQTTIGNSVEDTQTYQEIQQTDRKMNQNQVDIDQAYFGLSGDKEIDRQLNNLGSETAATLNDNGYLIKSGLVNNKKTLVVQGKDATGLFYAINNLNNLINKKSDLTNVNISESPQMSIRGVIEGFYGEPWSQQARKDLFKFMGEHKMNVYIYSPKDDDYLRNNWKELYPQDKLDQIKDLVAAAKKNHVSFVYTLSPGNDITYSSQEDFDKTVAKLNQLKEIGVTQFYIALDDIPLGMTSADSEVFKNHATKNYPNNPWSALADAQAYYVNRVQNEYIKKNNLPDLWLVPTNYSGSQQDPFKEAQGEALDKNIRLQWTGEGVFSGDITDDSVEQAKKTYNSDHIFIWDNFPVNDSDQDRLYLNPLKGRSKRLYKIMDGFTSNPMIQPYASWLGIAGYGDYMWNADTYNPLATQDNIIREMAGDDPDALVAMQSFVDLNQYWDYAATEDKVHAPILSTFINAFEESPYGSANYETNKAKLLERLDIIANTPETLKNMKVTGFYNDSLPWINAASHWAKAMISSINILDKINSGQTTSAMLSNDFSMMSDQINQANVKAVPDSRTGKPDLVITPSVGDGVFQNFINKSYEAINNWLGTVALTTSAQKVSSEASTDIPQNEDYAAANMNDGNLNTKFWSNRSIKKGDSIKVDLKDTQEIQRIDIHQGTDDNATSGDLFQSAVIYTANEADGSDKVAVGQVGPTGNYQLNLNQPVKARYLFIISTSNTDNWLQIRDISVFDKTGLNISNIKGTDNSSSQAIFDGTVQTAFTGQLENSQKTGIIEQRFASVNDKHELYLAGKVSGTVYVNVDGNWKELGRVESKQSLNKMTLPAGSIDGIKLVVDSNTGNFVINEFGLS